MNPDHSDTARAVYYLRIAAAFIATHPEQTVTYDDYDEPVDGEILARDCLSHADALAASPASMTFHGKITQAGGDGDATITITTQRDELKRCPSIPLYQPALITIKPLRKGQ